MLHKDHSFVSKQKENVHQTFFKTTLCLYEVYFSFHRCVPICSLHSEHLHKQFLEFLPNSSNDKKEFFKFPVYKKMFSCWTVSYIENLRVELHAPMFVKDLHGSIRCTSIRVHRLCYYKVLLSAHVFFVVRV